VGRRAIWPRCAEALEPHQKGKKKQLRPEKQRKPIHQVGSEADEDSDESLTSVDAVKQMGGKVATTIESTCTNRRM